jgi:hypothetical protein
VAILADSEALEEGSGKVRVVSSYHMTRHLPRFT